MEDSVPIYHLPMPFNVPVETRSHAEYYFLGWLHGLKYDCEEVSFRWEILDSKYVSGIDEKSVRFEVIVFDPDDHEQTAYSAESVQQAIADVRLRYPDRSVRVKLWHWAFAVTLPPVDPELRAGPLAQLRTRQSCALAIISANAQKRGGRVLSADSIIRGILDGRLFKGKHRPIVDRVTFDVCQDVLNGRARRIAEVKLNLPLAGGLFRCHYCGAAITGEHKKRKLRGGGVREHVYYFCSNPNKPADQSECPLVRARACRCHRRGTQEAEAARP